MTAAVALCHSTDPGIELLWASPRELLNIVQADQTGCHIVTVTADILAKLPLLGKDFATWSAETIAAARRSERKSLRARRVISVNGPVVGG